MREQFPIVCACTCVRVRMCVYVCACTACVDCAWCAYYVCSRGVMIHNLDVSIYVLPFLYHDTVIS